MKLGDLDALKNSILDSHPDDLQQSDINFDTGDIKIWLSSVLKFIDNAPTVKPERPQGEIIKCKDCKYQVKKWREDKRMKEKGYWVYGCKHFGALMGFWGWGGYDNEFCSDAEQKGDEENDT